MTRITQKRFNVRTFARMKTTRTTELADILRRERKLPPGGYRRLLKAAHDARLLDHINRLARETSGAVFGNAIYVDIEIAADGALSVEEAHKIADVVHDKIESLQEYRIKHCNVHVNPYTEEKDAETKQHADAHNGDAP